MSATESEIFKPESKTIKEIFGDTKSFYLMPEYQRPYSWDDVRVAQLWDDVKTSFENFTESVANGDVSIVDENYFLGSVILTPAKGGFEVVDGQQRLTTLVILFCVIRDIFPGLNKGVNWATETEVVTIADINNSISDNNQRSRLRLLTHLNNQNDFENEIIDGIKWPVKFSKDDKQNKKYLNTAILFKEYLLEMKNSSSESIVPFINYLFNRVRIIRITCSSQAFAIKLFQVLNTRGLDLAPADLIKSYLYGNISHYEKDSEQIELKRKQLMQEWTKIEIQLDATDDSITDMFNTYLYFISATNPRRTLYEELQPYLASIDPLKFIYDFKSFINNYINVYNTKDSTIYSLFYLQHQLYWKPILAGAKEINFRSYESLKSVVRRFYYLYWIAGYTSPKIKQISFNILKWIKGKVDFTENENDDEFTRFQNFSKLTTLSLQNFIVNSGETYSLDFSKSLGNELLTAINFKLEEKLKLDGVEDKVISNINENCYNESWLKPLLILIEYKQWDNERGFIEMNRTLHVEHIMPQSRAYKYWTELYSPKDHEDYLMKIENLTLLSGDRNIQASNRPFNLAQPSSPKDDCKELFDENLKIYIDKKFIYAGNEGKGMDGTTSFLISQKVIKDYVEWSSVEMKSRRKWLLGEIGKILEINLS
jgi:uncharacterized protein with ParB-like and HNH nuclease domain